MLGVRMRVVTVILRAVLKANPSNFYIKESYRI